MDSTRTCCLSFLVSLTILSLGALAGPASRAAAPGDQASDQMIGPGVIVDSITLGDSASESAHELSADNSEVVAAAAFDTPARRLLPPTDGGWEGGRIAFDMKIDPATQNYFSGRFWGSQADPNRLILFIDGKQVGYRHLGDVDILDFGSDSDSGGYPGRFYYSTNPLPIGMTKGKSKIHCEIRSTGPVWGYANDFQHYQKAMVGPSRNMFTFYTHTDGFLMPPADERQGSAPQEIAVRQSPGSEVLEALKKRVDTEISKELDSNKPLTQVQMKFLAEAYFVPWCGAFHNAKVVNVIIRGCDSLYADFAHDPTVAQSDPAVYNGGWVGLGMAGDAIRLLIAPLSSSLDQPIDGQAGTSRRAAWSKMLQASRDWHRANRRMYTNQSMITDLNIYRDNRGVAAIDPPSALPESTMLSYLYQSIGLEPWLGSETGHGPARPMGDHYFELTRNGLSRELGYVGYYGEVLDWVTQIYDATREPRQPGDAKIKEQLEKIANARAVFRYPLPDAQGNRAMRIETIVGWRDMHYPGDVCYAERPTWDASSIYAPAATLEAHLSGYAQQMFEDNQFFASVQNRMAEKSLRVTAGLLHEPEDYEVISKQPANNFRLPMSPGQPDFVFADEEDGVVAIKNGDEILYASLYWRARYAVNFLARVHYMTPQMDRLATVKVDEQFQPSGKYYLRPDWINFGFGNGGPKYPVAMHSALEGERLPIAQLPVGDNSKPGDEDPNSGRADFYQLRYGPYLIAMNMSDDKNYDLDTGGDAFTDLKKHVAVARHSVLKIGPRSTSVLFTSKN